MDLQEKPAHHHHRHPWEMARAEVATSLIKDQVSDLSNKNILDLGCGDLFFLQEFSRNSHNSKFYAVDIAFKDEDLNRDFGPDFKIFKSLTDLPNDENFIFDIVFIMDVVEHIQNDLDFLEDLRDSPYFSNKTLFLITVPAFQSLFSSHDVFLGHYRRYTNDGLNQLIEKAGYNSIEIGYFFTSLLLPRYLHSLREKISTSAKKTSGTGLTHWKHSYFISKIAARILFLDYKIQKLFRNLGFKLPGLSNYIICRKSV